MLNNNYTILIVDDNEDNRELLSNRLSALGFNIVVAEDGKKALEVLHVQLIDLVLLDIMMPEIDGITVLSRIRSDNTYDDMAVIMLTAIDIINVAEDCLRRGANGYITKPYDMELIKQKIRQCLKLAPRLVDIKTDQHSE
jgi:CheY-like chemotaxis protein